MSNLKSDALFEALDDLLEQEREALLTGDLEKVGKLLQTKEGFIEDLAKVEEFETKALEALQGKMQRNHDLLDSALEGIRAVATRLAALRRVRTTLDTYDAKGEKQSIEIAKDGSLEKRA